MFRTIERLARTAGVQFNLVPYKGATDMMQALLGRHLDVWADGGFGPGVDSGKFRLLATAGENRAGRWPNVPTLKELGVNAADYSPWGIVGPAGMEPAVVKTLHDALRKAMDEPEFMAVLGALAQEPVYMGSDDYRKYALDAIAFQKTLVDKYGLKQN